jgi:hypothetical protein
MTREKYQTRRRPFRLSWPVLARGRWGFPPAGLVFAGRWCLLVVNRGTVIGSGTTSRWYTDGRGLVELAQVANATRHDARSRWRPPAEELPWRISTSVAALRGIVVLPGHFGPVVLVGCFCAGEGWRLRFGA